MQARISKIVSILSKISVIFLILVILLVYLGPKYIDDTQIYFLFTRDQLLDLMEDEDIPYRKVTEWGNAPEVPNLKTLKWIKPTCTPGLTA